MRKLTGDYLGGIRTHDLLCSFILKQLYFVFLLFSFLAKRGIKEDITNFDARKISPEIRAGVEELLGRNGASFEPQVRTMFFIFSCVYCFHFFQTLC